MKLYEVLGPHEGQELEMMLSGSKPLALVGETKFENFKPYIKKGGFVYEKIYTMNDQNYAVAIPEEKWRIQALKNIYENGRKFGSLNFEQHKMIGKLFGYSEKDIEDFIKGQE